LKKSRTKRKRPAGKTVNYDLFTGGSKRGSAFDGSAARKLVGEPIKSKSQLPTINELQHLFNRLNHFYFEGKLEKAQIEYSNRMTCAGSYFPDERLIKISRKYHEIFPGEIEDTLKHEMIHIRHFYHDSSFKAEAKRIGASLKAKTHPLLLRPPKFLYVCPGCGLEYPRQKRMHKYSCGDCSANKNYDERFRLKLVRPSKSASKHS